MTAPARKPAIATKQVENDEVIVTQWRFPPHSETGHHTHAYDYVVVPTVPGVLTIEDVSGAVTESPLTLGGSYARKAGVSHNVANDSEAEIVFVEIELKR
ncbi:MAG: cupin domain-containing protein [Alphaproteobacteria bacterium]|nr:cupin domain-containing protein [Alphaproteobacteria bacterium]